MQVVFGLLHRTKTGAARMGGDCEACAINSDDWPLIKKLEGRDALSYIDDAALERRHLLRFADCRLPSYRGNCSGTPAPGEPISLLGVLTPTYFRLVPKSSYRCG